MAGTCVQDKDESPESLRAGVPVVSFSIGDAADFAYGPSRDEDRCRVVRLESGDVLVFGGAARMVYHAVRAVHAGTAPPELVLRTNLRPGRLNLTFRQK
jgi:alkylated DNA repair dioxygenase AlkB